MTTLQLFCEICNISMQKVPNGQCDNVSFPSYSVIPKIDQKYLTRKLKSFTSLFIISGHYIYGLCHHLLLPIAVDVSDEERNGQY